MTAEPRDSYYEFAYLYDRALGERFLAGVTPLLEHLLGKYPANARTHLDLACGTGLALRWFAARGFTSTGVDGSMAMLQLARRRGARVVASDLRCLAVRGTFERVTCLYDSLNHLLRTEDLVAAFGQAASVMGDQSLFLFDVNHPEAYPRIWGATDPFVAQGEGYLLEMDTSYTRKNSRGVARLSGWVDIDGARYELSETHEQRAYTEREVRRALKDAGLDVVEVVDFDPFDPAVVPTDPTKLFFVARKK